MQRSSLVEHLKPNSLQGNLYFMILYNAINAYLAGKPYIDVARFYPDGVNGAEAPINLVLCNQKLYDYLPGLKVRYESPRRVRPQQIVSTQEEKTAIIDVSHLWAKFCFMLFYHKQWRQLENKNRSFVKKEVNDLLSELSKTMQGIDEYKVNLYVLGILLRNFNPRATTKILKTYSQFINQLASKCISHINSRSSLSEKIAVFVELNRAFSDFEPRFTRETIESLPPLVTILNAQKVIVRRTRNYASRLNVFQTLITDWCKVKDCRAFTSDYLHWIIVTHTQLSQQHAQLETRLSRGMRVLRRGLCGENRFGITVGLVAIGMVFLFNVPNFLMIFGMLSLFSYSHHRLMEVQSKILHQLRTNDSLTAEERIEYEKALSVINNTLPDDPAKFHSDSELMKNMVIGWWMLVPALLMFVFVGYMMFANYLNLPSEPKPRPLPSWVQNTLQEKLRAEHQAEEEGQSDNSRSLGLNKSST